jgi:hypothetical protein
MDLWRVIRMYVSTQGSIYETTILKQTVPFYDERTKHYSQEMLLDGPSSFENQINRDLDIYTYLYR